MCQITIFATRITLFTKVPYIIYMFIHKVEKISCRGISIAQLVRALAQSRHKSLLVRYEQ